MDLPYADGDFFFYEPDLLPDERAVLERVRDWARTRVRPLAVDSWTSDAFPRELIPSIAELDIISLVGHHGRSHLLAGLVIAELHRADASIGTFFSGHDGLFTGSIELLGSEEQKARYLPDLYAVRKTGVFAITERDAGSDVAKGLTTTARRDGDDWILSGRKRWIGNATFADYVLVWARDTADDQVKGFIVDTSLPGFRAEFMPGRVALRAVENAEVVLDDVRVAGADKLAGANSFRDTNTVFKAVRSVAGWQAVGIQMATFDLVRDYVVRREQFDRPLASFQLVQERLATILGNLQSSQAMMARLAAVQDSGRARAEHSALAKAFVTTRMRESTAIGRSLFGGNGLVAEHGMAKVWADAEAIYTYEGTYEINSLIVGRAITGISAFV